MIANSGEVSSLLRAGNPVLMCVCVVNVGN